MTTNTFAQAHALTKAVKSYTNEKYQETFKKFVNRLNKRNKQVRKTVKREHNQELHDLVLKNINKLGYEATNPKTTSYNREEKVFEVTCDTKDEQVTVVLKKLPFNKYQLTI